MFLDNKVRSNEIAYFIFIVVICSQLHFMFRHSATLQYLLHLCWPIIANWTLRPVLKRSNTTVRPQRPVSKFPPQRPSDQDFAQMSVAQAFNKKNILKSLTFFVYKRTLRTQRDQYCITI